jgi:hypothetical protein
LAALVLVLREKPCNLTFHHLPNLTTLAPKRLGVKCFEVASRAAVFVAGLRKLPLCGGSVHAASLAAPGHRLPLRPLASQATDGGLRPLPRPSEPSLQRSSAPSKSLRAGGNALIRAPPNFCIDCAASILRARPRGLPDHGQIREQEGGRHNGGVRTLASYRSPDLLAPTRCMPPQSIPEVTQKSDTVIDRFGHFAGLTCACPPQM